MDQNTENPGLKSTFKECVLDNIWFKILSLSSIILIFISFFMPPEGVIDSSVISATGELLAWGALYSVIKAIERGKSVSFKHGNSELEIRKAKEKELLEKDEYDNPES